MRIYDVAGAAASLALTLISTLKSLDDDGVNNMIKPANYFITLNTFKLALFYSFLLTTQCNTYFYQNYYMLSATS
jgi:hypothetical protein